MAMIRRFVNILSENYSLHRLDVSKHLFYPSTAHALQAAATGGSTTMERLLELPPPCTHFERVQTDTENISTFFFGLVGGSRRSSSSEEGWIFYMDHLRQSYLYNAEASVTTFLPAFKGDKGRRPILFSVAPPEDENQPGDSVAPPEDQNEPGEDIYVMARALHCEPDWGSCFDVLRFGKADWEALPPPPFVDSSLGYGTYGPAMVCSHAMVDGGRTICVSFNKGFGTYCFDTVKHSWRQVGDDWVLPFGGGAEYIKDLNLWLGFSRENPLQLCWTQDLSSMVMDQPPQLQGFSQDLLTPENWFLTTARLVNLGSGRFCITRLFEVNKGNDTLHPVYCDYLDECRFAVLTGVEISRGAQGPSLLKHKSILYEFKIDGIQYVL